jgi:hypothetical protein
VSGTVQAPNAQIAFAHPPGFIERAASLLNPIAYASIAGLSPVPDGTQVQLVRLNGAGTGFSVLATTVTAGGSYSFDLKSLNLELSNDLCVRVADGPVQMRGFVTGSHVDLDPISETSVRLVLERLVATPGATLSLFTIQELADITGSINALVIAQLIRAGLNIETTITSIRGAVTADSRLMEFIAAAAGNGQTSLGPGDIGNFVPLTQGNIWRYQATKSGTGQQTLDYQNTIRVAGKKTIGAVVTTILSESNSDGGGIAQEEYVLKDSQGINEYGTNDSTDNLSPPLVPYRTLRFPLAPNSSFTAVHRTGVDFGQDLDGDGRNDTAAVSVQVSVIGVESVSVPVSVFTDALKVQTLTTVTVTYSRSGLSETVTQTQTQWLAPGVGPVRNTTVTQGQLRSETITEELVAYVVDGRGAGIRIEVTPSSLATRPNVQKSLQATAFDQSDMPISGIALTWVSSNPAIAQVAQDGTLTGIAPGTANVTASADGLTSNAVHVTVNDMRLLTVTANDIIYDGFRQKMYASIPSRSTSNPNSITVIDPVTGNLGVSLPVGSEPTKLAISDDGQFLYVGLDGEAAVRQVNLSTFNAGQKFSLGTTGTPSSVCGDFKASDLKVLPGAPQSVAVARSAIGCTPLFSVAVYDNGVQRPNATASFGGPLISSITFPQSQSTLYGHNGVSTGSEFWTMTIDTNGVSVADTTGGLLSSFALSMAFDADRIYVSDGTIIDPVSRSLVGTFQDPLLTFQSLGRPDSSLSRMFFVSGRPDSGYTLLKFDMSSLQLTGSMPIDVVVDSPPIGFHSIGIDSLIRWGSDGIAFRSSNHVFLLHTSSIQ